MPKKSESTAADTRPDPNAALIERAQAAHKREAAELEKREQARQQAHAENLKKQLPPKSEG